MLLSATLSKANSDVEEKLGKPYIKIKIKAVSSANSKNEQAYYVEMFTQKQAFHKHLSEVEVEDFLAQYAGTTFRNCVERTETEEITILGSKKGKITRLVKKIDKAPVILGNPSGKKKNYLIPEGKPVPFLILLGVMTDEGKIISSKYDKFRQINRFLEFVNDILPEVIQQIQKEQGGQTSLRPIRIADFGCGKSYLTFAVHYFLTEIKKIPCEIEGLDLKEDVIRYCNQTAEKLDCKNLIFKTGDIAQYSADKNPDIVITLHACDTATDFALKYAVERNCKAILSVPCCQHQVNAQLNETEADSSFSSLLKWGIIKEKFSSLVTDALRGEWLEQQGYKVQMLEFIDMEHTPKNILIRAIKSDGKKQNEGVPDLMKALKIKPEIFKA